MDGLRRRIRAPPEAIMSEINRREFIAGGAAVGMTILARSSAGSPNDAIRVAVVGVNGRGRDHLRGYGGLKKDNVEVVAVCDIDENILNGRLADFEKREGKKPKGYTDIRKLCEDKEIDVVSIATPNHWHSLAAIWACQAGKDVYVEKPLSHNVWEGRKLVEAAQKYKRIVQHGTQCRSNPGIIEAMQKLREGVIGKVYMAKGLCYKWRNTIGKTPESPVPSGVNYDMWLGPAPVRPFSKNRFHYNWHWVWATGNGDIGNQGIHEMDMCRWMLGEETLPRRVFSIGGRFGYVDDAETPNTQIAVFDYPSAPLIFEVRGLTAQAGVNHMDHYRGVRIGISIECENGYFAGGAGGGVIYDPAGKKVKGLPSAGGGTHMANFIQAVRNRKPQDLKAPIAGAHLSSALCHLGNISHRLGSQVPLTDLKAQAASRAEVAEAVDRFASHLAANGVDPARAAPTLGPVLDLVPGEERFVSQSEYDLGAWANQLLRDHYRPPFVVPEKV
jgi:predicted dehydrogenase